jgi:RNA polymerase sigma-70 factor (ECF subfamily)
MLVPVGRGAAVEDLAQETFMRAFRALPRFVDDGGGKLGAWLLTIATRAALNELRKRRVGVDQFDTVAETVHAERGDPATESRVIGRAIDEAVAALPDKFRAAFLLRELHGLEYADIARSLEVDVGTVKSRLSRARARLRAALTEVTDG